MDKTDGPGAAGCICTACFPLIIIYFRKNQVGTHCPFFRNIPVERISEHKILIAKLSVGFHIQSHRFYPGIEILVFAVQEPGCEAIRIVEVIIHGYRPGFSA